MDSYQLATKIYYDRNAHVVNCFTPGQLVLLKNINNKKLDQRYPDLCTVIRKLHSHQYLIQRNSDNFRRKANIAQLKPYVEKSPDEMEKTRTKHVQTELNFLQNISPPTYVEPIESDSDSEHVYNDVIDLPPSTETYLLPNP